MSIQRNKYFGKEVKVMRWKCKNCGKTAVTNSESAKPTNGICKKDKNGNVKQHVWVKA